MSALERERSSLALTMSESDDTAHALVSASENRSLTLTRGLMSVSEPPLVFTHVGLNKLARQTILDVLNSLFYSVFNSLSFGILHKDIP